MGGHGVVLSRARGKSERRVELGDGTTFGSGRYLDEAPSTRGAEARSMATACPLLGRTVEHLVRERVPNFAVQNGIFGLDSDLGACSKVVVHKLLSNFY